MMKKLVSLTAAVMLMAGLMAQNVQVTTVQIGETTANGYTITIDKDLKLSEQAMQKRLKEAKLKTSKAKPFTACLNQQFADLASVPVNFYFKMEEKGKKKDRSTELTVCVIPTDLTIDQEALQNNVRKFLEGFPQYVARFEAGNSMEEQQKLLEKAQKNLKNAEGDFADIEKSIKKDQDKIASKKKDIENYKSKIADAEKDIKDLESNIKKSNDQKGPAQKKIDEAKAEVKRIETEVEKYRRLTE
ncbi:MAG: hypothetical protein J6I49_08470 [Bacteroidales bacterium]|nr:hypothetical protein [Bacteroidales bacterium]